MNDVLNFKTNIIGLIGHPLKQTYSPYIQNLAFSIKKLNYYYIPFDIDSLNLKKAIKGMISLRFKGFNVTLPYKTKVVQYLNFLSEEASIIGSVNTVNINEDNIQGFNTDVFGIFETLNNYKIDLNDSEFSIFGAGGSARALIYTLIKFFRPRKINLINRTEDRALVLKDLFKEKMKFNSIDVIKLLPPDIIEIVQNSKLVVNTTPIGMYPEIDDCIINSEKFFNKNQIVFDLIYNPQMTKFLEFAKKSNAEIINGLNMLIYQAAKSFEIWTSETFPFDEIKSSFEKILNEKKYNI
jgi:shikimate dehydrogenase